MNEHLREKILSSENVFNGKVLNIRVDQVELPDGMLSMREVIVHPGAVAVIPITDDGKVIFVRQWRNAAAEALLEIPAGGKSINENPVECAERELMEEIGYRPGNLIPLQSIYLAPGYSSEYLHLFIATDLSPERLPHDEDERLEIVIHSWDEIDELMNKGEFKDAKTIAGLILARRKLGI